MNARRCTLTLVLVLTVAATADAAWRDWVPFTKKSQSRTSMLDDRPVVSNVRNSKKPTMIGRMSNGTKRMWRSTTSIFRKKETDRRPISGETRRIRGRMPEKEDRGWFSWFRKKEQPEPKSVDPMREFLGGDRPGF